MAGIFRVRSVISGGSGSTQLGTMYFTDNGTLTAQHAADAVHTFWEGVKTLLVNTYTVQVENAVETIDPATGQPTSLTAVTGALTTGTGGTNPQPFATQLLAQWRTGAFIGGREVRGRTFIPGTITGSNAAGAVSAATVTTVQNAQNALIGDVLSDLVLYSRKNRLAVGVVSGSCWNKFAVLRSRRD